MSELASADPSIARVNGIELAYEEFGDPERDTILLVMGLGMQMLGWDIEFCEQLADRGHHVVRFDNRDVGLSTKLKGRPNVQRAALGLTGSAQYRLADMALDAAGLLDHLEVGAAHVVGASMGGMIGQTLAARHPERVLSLCTIMAGPGGRSMSFLPKPDVIGTLLTRPPSSRNEYVEHVVGLFSKIGSPGYPHDAARLRQRAHASFERSYNPAGTGRQLVAIMASGNRLKELREIRCPTLVIHGAEDRLVPVAAGRAVAAAIPGSRLEVFTGMGHDLPPALWPRFIDLILENAARAANLDRV